MCNSHCNLYERFIHTTSVNVSYYYAAVYANKLQYVIGIQHPGPNAAGLEKILEWTVQFKTSWKFFWGPLKSGQYFICGHGCRSCFNSRLPIRITTKRSLLY